MPPAPAWPTQADLMPMLPEMIATYLDEEPIIEKRGPTLHLPRGLKDRALRGLAPSRILVVKSSVKRAATAMR